MNLKKTPIAVGVAGDDKPTPPPRELLASMAAEVLTRNADVLVANYIKNNPDVPAEEIQLQVVEDSTGTHFSVARVAGTWQDAAQSMVDKHFSTDPDADGKSIVGSVALHKDGKPWYRVRVEPILEGEA